MSRCLFNAFNKLKQVCRGYGDTHGYGYVVDMGIEIPSPRQPYLMNYLSTFQFVCACVCEQITRTFAVRNPIFIKASTRLGNVKVATRFCRCAKFHFGSFSALRFTFFRRIGTKFLYRAFISNVDSASAKPQIANFLKRRKFQLRFLLMRCGTISSAIYPPFASNLSLSH